MKSYGQLCPIARALDVLGDRWTLLVVRELLLGEKRFGEILSMLPAMGTNRLSDRLALLCANNVVEKTLSAASGGKAAYALTPFGERLRKPILELALWGMSLTAYENEDLASARAELVALGLSAAVDASRLAGREAIYDFHVGTERFHVTIGNSEMWVRSGVSPQPSSMALSCTLPSFLSLIAGELAATEAIQQGKILIATGDQKDLIEIVDLLRFRRAEFVAN